MRVLQINTFPYKATGNIMLGIHEVLQRNNHESFVIWGRGRAPSNNSEFSIKDTFGMYYHIFLTRVFDLTGFGSKQATKKLLSHISSINPDVVHMHNLHGYYINIEMLFEYLNTKDFKVIWTLHDCWPMTGHCAYFDMVGCNRWKDGCHNCPQKPTYPKSILFDNSKRNWIKKKELFNKVEIELVSVSSWLNNIVGQSYLNKNSRYVIYNGIDLDVFKERGSTFREEYNIENKYIILGVANEWTKRKGLDDFVQLAEILDDRFVIVLVGLKKTQINTLPKNIMGFERTGSVQSLVEIYSTCDVFFNASVEETMGMTTIEAMACGTLPIVYDATASPELLSFRKDLIVKKNEIQAVRDIIEDVYLNGYESSEFVEQAKKYEMNLKFSQYLNLYDV